MKSRDLSRQHFQSTENLAQNEQQNYQFDPADFNVMHRYYSDSLGTVVEFTLYGTWWFLQFVIRYSIDKGWELAGKLALVQLSVLALAKSLQCFSL